MYIFAVPVILQTFSNFSAAFSPGDQVIRGLYFYLFNFYKILFPLRSLMQLGEPDLGCLSVDLLGEGLSMVSGFVYSRLCDIQSLFLPRITY